MKVLGGYGSAGAGNKTGRMTMTRGGASKTAAVRVFRTTAIQASGLPMPTEEERDDFVASIQMMRCWWCGLDKNRLGRPWQSLSHHWGKGHHISSRDVAIWLGLPKKTTFLSPAFRTQSHIRGKRNVERYPDRFPPKKPRQCVVCGATFFKVNRRLNRKTCSPECDSHRRCVQAAKNLATLRADAGRPVYAVTR